MLVGHDRERFVAAGCVIDCFPGMGSPRQNRRQWRATLCELAKRRASKHRSLTIELLLNLLFYLIEGFMEQ